MVKLKGKVKLCQKTRTCFGSDQDYPGLMEQTEDEIMFPSDGTTFNFDKFWENSNQFPLVFKYINACNQV